MYLAGGVARLKKLYEGVGGSGAASEMTPLLLWVLAMTLDVACDHSLDRALCESRACRGYAWCELCGRCLAEALAVKDEL